MLTRLALILNTPPRRLSLSKPSLSKPRWLSLSKPSLSKPRWLSLSKPSLSKPSLIFHALILFTLSSLASGRSVHSPRPDIALADFDGEDYAGWAVEGSAFGERPARGTLPNQMPVSGYLGRGLVNSYLGGDGATGTLTSPPFVIARKRIRFLIGGGQHPDRTCINLVLNGQVVRTATGPNDRPGGSERLSWASWDVSEFEGLTARIRIVDTAAEGWGHINVDQITMSDTEMEAAGPNRAEYDEAYRPQFHFTSKRNWLNDPNGLVYYKGEYHLFFQHNPFGTEWGNMTWGHAVSRDLLHWKQLPDAIRPDRLGTVFSGSAVIDHENTGGFAANGRTAMIALYTAAGGTSEESKGQPFTQCLAYSLDRGRTFQRWNGNPILGHVEAENRDPKVVWHAPTRRWIMALYLNESRFALFRSPDLKRWDRIQTVEVPGSSECPDFFELPVVGMPGVSKWVFTAANGLYLVGDFDGSAFTPEGPPQRPDWGGNFYAVQTYSDLPKADGRRIQIAWMRGGEYPGMPFNQQMSIPCALTLRPTSDGLRLYRWPVQELDRLRGVAVRREGIALEADRPWTLADKGELWDIEAEFEIGSARTVGLRALGETVQYDVQAAELVSHGHRAPLAPDGGRIRIRAIVDRTSLEVFGNDGRVSLSSCVLFPPQAAGIEVFSEGGASTLLRVTAYPLRRVWK